MQSLKARADGWEEMSGYGSALLFCRSVGLGGGLLKMKALKFNKMISDSQDGGHVTILENIWTAAHTDREVNYNFQIAFYSLGC